MVRIDERNEDGDIEAGYNADSREEAAAIIEREMAYNKRNGFNNTFHVFETVEREIFFDFGLTWRD